MGFQRISHATLAFIMVLHTVVSQTPSSSPTMTHLPSLSPSMLPSTKPSIVPTPMPSFTPWPSGAPSEVPIPAPTPAPTSVPTYSPTPRPTHVPTYSPTPAPSMPTPVPTDSPTHFPTPFPTHVPTHIPSPVPSITPVPSVSFEPTSAPTIAPSGVPSSVPTPVPSPVPTPSPTTQPTISTQPTLPPTTSPTTVPTSSPTTIADFYPKYVLTLLVRCIQFDETNLQGPSNHTYWMTLTAGPGNTYETQVPVVFKGIGYVTADGQPVSYSDYNPSDGDLSCDVDEGGGSKELALIYDYEIGSATTLDFQDASGNSLGTRADDIYELSQVCFTQKTPGRRPNGHDGVQIDVAVTQYDVAGTTTYVMNKTVDMHNIFDVDVKVCSFLHPLSYDFKFGGYNNQTVEDLKQNSIPFEATIKSEFDADISMIAFPYDDNVTQRADRAAIATQYGDRVVSTTEVGAYIRQTNPDYYYSSREIARELVGYELSAAWEGRFGGEGNGGGVRPLCDAACVAAGGAYQSWHVTTVIEWNFTKSDGNTNSLWADAQDSTYGKPLRMYDERRYFAVTYDKTEPTFEIDSKSIKFTYSYNYTGCGNRYWDPNFKSAPTALISDTCIPTATEDVFTMNVTISEEGAYYFYAHPSFEQKALEANFSAIVGKRWPLPVTELGLYSLHYACDTNTNMDLDNCDSIGGFPREQQVIVPTDAEAYMFGYDFSFSEFAVYGYVQDDGFVSENIDGNGYNRAAGYDEFRSIYGNQSYDLVTFELYNQLISEDLYYRSNNFNTSQWADTRYLVLSTPDSNFDNIITLTADNDGYTSNFGRRCKIFFGLNELANEFDYTSHRKKYYNRLLQPNVLEVKRYEMENYLINTDSFYNEMKTKESQYYNITRTDNMETVWLVESSDMSEAIAASDANGGQGGYIILNLNLTSAYSGNYFYMIGQQGSGRGKFLDNAVPVDARLRLVYSNDPLFQFVPVMSTVSLTITNVHLDSVLLDSSSGEYDDSGRTIDAALPSVNVTAKNGIDYTTDDGGTATLLVSLTVIPQGYVTFSVSIPDKTQAKITHGAVLTFSPTNYMNLEVDIEGVNDFDNTNGDVPYDVVFTLLRTEDTTYNNRYDVFHFSHALTNLATKSDTRLAVSVNATGCHTSEWGGSCDMLVMVCAHNSEGAVDCEAPFSTLPIFTNGITKVAVSLNLTDRFEAEITSIRSNGRFDASSSRIECEDGLLDDNGNDVCGATVVFEPSTSDTVKAQGPYYAWVTLTGVKDYVLDGRIPFDVILNDAKIVRGRAVSDDYVVYNDKVTIYNKDSDTSNTVLDKNPGVKAGMRYFDVYAGTNTGKGARCETSESTDVGACPVTIDFNFDQLNNSVSTRYDDIGCVKLTMELSYQVLNSSFSPLLDRTNNLDLTIKAFTETLYNPRLAIGDFKTDFYGDVSYIIGNQPFTGLDLGAWQVADVSVDYKEELFDIFSWIQTVCVPPGNTTVSFLNATHQFKPTSGIEGGWTGKIHVTGTDQVLFYTPDFPTKIDGNFSINIPNEGVPLFLKDKGPVSATIEVNISTGVGGLEISRFMNSTTSGAPVDFSLTHLNTHSMLTATITEDTSFSFYVDSSDDDIDDDDEMYEIYATVTSVTHRFYRGDTNFTISPKSQAAVIPVYHYDDDTAGVLLESMDSAPLYSYRTDRSLVSDAEGGGHRYFGMVHNTTSEGYFIDAEGDPQRVNGTWFNVSLTSEPRSDVTIKVTSPPIQNKWGWQIEGIPVGGYKVNSYVSASPWITGTNDTVRNPVSGGLELTFTSANWNIPQTVNVVGLDDFLDDGDTPYSVKLTSSSSDLYYDSASNNTKNAYSSNSYNTNGYMPLIHVPLLNIDDETASFVALQNGSQCSEPFYDMTAGLQMYLTSKPSGVVSVWLASSDPNEAKVDRELVAFTPDNWETMQTVVVSSIDDFAADGDIEFDVSIDLFYASDEQYNEVDLFVNSFNFTSIDDPNDAMGVGAAVQFEVTSDNNYTTALGGEVSIAVTLSYKPQAPVYISITTSNQNQGVLTTASTLVFTSANYADVQTVTVKGVDDGERDGDTFYTLVLGLESTDDPYYARFAFSPEDNTVTYDLINRDYAWARVRPALSVDTMSTSERDVTTGNSAALTVALCEAIYGAVEDGGVAGRQATKKDQSMCGGYSLEVDTLFGDDYLSFVTTVVEVSDTSEAMLECESTAYKCSTSYDGSMATLRFDADMYTMNAVNTLTPQLKIVGLNDFLADGDAAYNVSVTASMKYGNERHEVLDSYLPSPLDMLNVDDDQSYEEESSWYTIDPAVGCSVFETDGTDTTLPDDCTLTVNFNDVVSDLIEASDEYANGDAFAYVLTLNISQEDSKVYFDSVSASEDIIVEGDFSHPGDIDLTLFFLNPTYRWNGNVTFSVGLKTVDDVYDDGDHDFSVSAFGFVMYNCSEFITNQTGSASGCNSFLSVNSSYTVTGTEYDDDTAGLEFIQNNHSFYAYRTGRDDGYDDDTTSLRTISLPSNSTYEDGSEYGMFGIQLSSRPEFDVVVEVTAQALTDQWGVGRFEGIPSMNMSTDGSDYRVIKYVSPASWIDGNRTKDSVANPDAVGLTLTFSTHNWNVTQNVMVVGLDDLAADGDVSYNLYVSLNGTEGDKYRYAPSEEGFQEPVRVPFTNIDDEASTPGWSAMQYGTKVSEPFYGFSSSIVVYPLTEPADVIMLSFSSTRPDIANTSETLVAISPSDWDQERTIYVKSVDNFLDDGDIDFDVVMLNLGSSDAAYADLITNETFTFTKLDDPEDSLYHDSTTGVGMTFATGINLYGVYQAFTTEYGGDGMYLDETAKTGTSTVMVKLDLKPQDTVTYSISVSDTSEAQVLYPSTIAFTPSNYDQYQEVVVIGRADTVADGDVEYDVQFNLLGTNDPYYAVLPLNSTSHSLINQDTVSQRVALGISSLNCLNITEGTDTSRGFSVSGLATCTVTMSLCLSDTEFCTQKLTEAEVYNISESLGIDSISLEVFMDDKSIARIQEPTANMGQINVTNNGSYAHIQLGIGRPLSTSVNLTVYATDDTIHDGKMVTDMMFYGVLQKNGKDIQEFVNYYDDVGDVTTTTTIDGESVRTGSISVVARDDEIPDIRFYKTEACNTAEYGRVDTPGQDVSDGTCLVYVRLGSEPTADVTITITSSDASEGLFAMSYDTDGTDSVDFRCSECPLSFTDSADISFDATNWDTARKVVLVGQDDTLLDGRQQYTLGAHAISTDTRFNGLNVSLSFANLDDESAFIEVSQNSVKLGARDAESVDESGYVNHACKPFTVLLDADIFEASPFISVMTISSSDATEGLVGKSCNPDLGGYSQNFTMLGSDLDAVDLNGGGSVFYYIAVDDDTDDGDIEFDITIEVVRPEYTFLGVTYPINISTYTFYVTNYDDDSLVINNPARFQQDDPKFTKRDNGHHTLELYEPFNFDTSSDPDSNRTGVITFSYPNNNTWDPSLTDFVAAQVKFNFSENVGQYVLSFEKSRPTLETDCTDIRMNDPVRPDLTCSVLFVSPYDYFQIVVTASPDDVDRHGHKSFVNISTAWNYTTRDTSGNLNSGRQVKSAWSQAVELVIYDDDLAGVTLNQTNSSSDSIYTKTAYRDFPRGHAQPQDATISSMTLPMSVTKEAGGNLSFSLALTSEPLYDTYVYIYSEQVTRSDGSETRYEGIPWPSTYDWTKYHPIGDYASMQVEDVVVLEDSYYDASLLLTFTSTDWSVPQDVLIVGLNDLYDDSTTDYDITIVIESSDPYYNQIGDVTLPLSNEDDDTAGLAAYWTDYSTGPLYGVVSEPYYAYDAYLYFYLTSKPTDTVLVTLVSSAPSEAMSTVAVAAIGPSDWDSPQSSLIYGVDDAVLDGKQNFTITLSVVYSGDSDYGTSDENTDGVAGRMTLEMDGYALDDPTDYSSTACAIGERGMYGNPRSNCTTCPMGTFAEVAGDKENCRLCPPGTFGVWTGSQGMGISEDYDGTELAPGCLPCPNGTYSDSYGATTCTVCPSDKYCWPLATTTPKRQKPWEQWSESFDRKWSQINVKPYSATVEFFGRYVEMNRDQYEAYLIVNSFFVWFFISAILLLVYWFAPHPIRDSMIRFLRHFDLFPRRHQNESKNEEYADKSFAPSALGGVISVGLFLLGLACTSIMFYIYTEFNTNVTSSLDVFNATFIDKVHVDVEVSVSFIGFSGCNNNTYVLGETNEGDPSIIVTGMSYDSSESTYNCKDGDLDMTMSLTRMKVVTNPKFMFKVEPKCSECTDSGLTPLFGTNTVLSCLPCAAASTQGFTYNIKSTNTWGEHPGVHDKDNNYVNGSEVPASTTDVFRGDEATTVEVQFMPTIYDNRQTAKKHKTYRLVYAGSELGSTQSFRGATDYYGTSSSVSKPSNFFTWVKEDSWVASDASNMVSFTVNMPLATSALSVVVENYESFLDVSAQVGGILGLLTAMFLLAMAYIERSDDQQDWIGSCTSAIMTYYRRQRAEMDQRWNPEPESWTMENIDKMQRREEKREGGARKVEEAAVTNFKDLYSRNNVVNQTSAMHQDDDEDFSHEVDEFHGQL